MLQVLPSLESGGVTQGTLDVAQAFVKKGGKMYVAAYPGSQSPELKPTGAELIPLSLHKKNPWSLLKNAFILKKIIQTHKIDLVHARSRGPAWCAYYACRRTGVPLVTTFHGTYNFHSFLKKLYNSIMVRGDRVIAISQFIYDHILENYGKYLKKPENLRLIFRGVDLQKFTPGQVSETTAEKVRTQWALKKSKPLILMPGRLTRWKGHLVLLKALTFFESPLPFQVVFLGPDQGRKAYRQELEMFIEKHQWTEDIKIIQKCNQMPVAYHLALGVIHASTDPEAFGRVIAEAQAMGKPVIASACGAPQEIIIDHQTGWLVPPGDPEKLAEALRKLLALTQEEREKIASLAQNRVKTHFSLTQMCDKTLEVYLEILEYQEKSP